MKIAVTASGPDLDSQIESRFGRCQYFIIVDTDTMEYEAIQNPNVAVGGGRRYSVSTDDGAEGCGSSSNRELWTKRISGF